MNQVCEVRQNTPSVTLFETLVTITKLSRNGIRESFWEGLKRICKLFEINVQQDF